MLGDPVHVTAYCPISSQIISNLLAREKTDEVGMILNFEEQWDGDRTRFTVEPNPAYEGTWCAQDKWELPSDKDEPDESPFVPHRLMSTDEMERIIVEVAVENDWIDPSLSEFGLKDEPSDEWAGHVTKDGRVFDVNYWVDYDGVPTARICLYPVVMKDCGEVQTDGGFDLLSMDAEAVYELARDMEESRQHAAVIAL